MCTCSENQTRQNQEGVRSEQDLVAIRSRVRVSSCLVSSRTVSANNNFYRYSRTRVVSNLAVSLLTYYVNSSVTGYRLKNDYLKDLRENNLINIAPRFGSDLDGTIEKNSRHRTAMVRVFRLRPVQPRNSSWAQKSRVRHWGAW